MKPKSKIKPHYKQKKLYSSITKEVILNNSIHRWEAENVCLMVGQAFVNDFSSFIFPMYELTPKAKDIVNNTEVFTTYADYYVVDIEWIYNATKRIHHIPGTVLMPECFYQGMNQAHVLFGLSPLYEIAKTPELFPEIFNLSYDKISLAKCSPPNEYPNWPWLHDMYRIILNRWQEVHPIPWQHPYPPHNQDTHQNPQALWFHRNHHISNKHNLYDILSIPDREENPTKKNVTIYCYDKLISISRWGQLFSSPDYAQAFLHDIQLYLLSQQQNQTSTNSSTSHVFPHEFLAYEPLSKQQPLLSWIQELTVKELLNPKIRANVTNQLKKSSKRYFHHTLRSNQFSVKKKQQQWSTVDSHHSNITSNKQNITTLFSRCQSNSLRIAFQNRLENRYILNLPSLISIAQNYSTINISLIAINGSTSLFDQYIAYNSFDLLIAVAGSHLTNMLFMDSKDKLIMEFGIAIRDPFWNSTAQDILHIQYQYAHRHQPIRCPVRKIKAYEKNCYEFNSDPDVITCFSENKKLRTPGWEVTSCDVLPKPEIFQKQIKRAIHSLCSKASKG